MPYDSPTEQRIVQLNAEIEQAKAICARIKIARAPLAREAANAAAKLRYLQFIMWLRRPAERHSWWQSAIQLVVPIFSGLLLFFIVGFSTDSYPLALTSLILGTGCASGISAVLLFGLPVQYFQLRSSPPNRGRYSPDLG